MTKLQVAMTESELAATDLGGTPGSMSFIDNARN
jgi:hypothetical protein